MLMLIFLNVVILEVKELMISIMMDLRFIVRDWTREVFV